MRTASIVRAAVIGLVGLVSTGCLEAGGRGYFDNSVYGSSDLKADVSERGQVVYVGSRSRSRL